MLDLGSYGLTAEDSYLRASSVLWSLSTPFDQIGSDYRA